jgi:hypothetical protein
MQVESIFGFLFYFLQLNSDFKKNSKAKVENALFFIFMSASAEMSFLDLKRLKSKRIFFK